MKIIIGAMLVLLGLSAFECATDQPKHQLTGRVKRVTVLSSVSYVNGSYREIRQYFDSNEACLKASNHFMLAVQSSSAPVVAVCSGVRYA